jgi:hypothetical protein
LEIYKWKSVHAVAIDHQVVVHPRVPLQEDHQVVVHPRVHNLEKSVLHAGAVLIEQVQLVKFLKVVKSVIHVGFDLLHKSEINHEFVHESLNLIFQMMSPAKSSKRVFALNY